MYHNKGMHGSSHPLHEGSDSEHPVHDHDLGHHFSTLNIDQSGSTSHSHDKSVDYQFVRAFAAKNGYAVPDFAGSNHAHSKVKEHQIGMTTHSGSESSSPHQDHSRDFWEEYYRTSPPPVEREGTVVYHKKDKKDEEKPMKKKKWYRNPFSKPKKTSTTSESEYYAEYHPDPDWVSLDHFYPELKTTPQRSDSE